MKSAVETLNPTRVKLTVEVPFDELKPNMDAAYKSIAAKVTVPGFRKGKVPPRIIDQRVGRGAVIEEAVNEALPEFYRRALEESEVRPLGQPTVDVTSVPELSGEGQLAFTAEVDVRPTLELPDLEGIAVSVDDLTVTDEDVAERIDALRARFGSLVPAERAVETGDFVTIDITATIDGDEIDAATGISYEVGAGNMLEGMDDQLVGMASGETKTFTTPLVGGDRKGEDAEITLTVQAVKIRQLPELDDAFAEMATEFDTVEELRTSTLEQVTQVKKFEQGLQARERLLDHLLETIEVPVPEGLIEAEVNSHLEGEGRLEDDEHRAEVDGQTRKAIAAQLLLDAIAEELKVSVEQGELVDYLVGTAQQYRMDPNAFIQMVSQQGQLPEMVSEVARRKALAVVLGKAKISDASGNEIDLDELVPADEADDIDMIEVSADDAEAAEAPVEA